MFTEAVSIAVSPTRGSVISESMFGINFALGYESFGSRPWDKFDDVQSLVGATQIRFPGGAEAETLFDYANPNATSATLPDGSVRQLPGIDAFLAYCGATGSKATIVLPTEQLLTGSPYGTRDFAAGMEASVRAYVQHVLDLAGPGGISTFELGNEYATYMTSAEYGKVASALAAIVADELDSYYQDHPGYHGDRPEVAVQIWSSSINGGMTLDALAARNETVMAQFSAAELNAVTAVVDHFYYEAGSHPGAPNFHSYANIGETLSYTFAMMNTWDQATGRTLDHIMSEWNVNHHDTGDFGLKQIPILLELFDVMVASGMDELDFWSTLYKPTALANPGGGLQAAGVIFDLMSDRLIGKQSMEVPVTSDNFDVHAYLGGGAAVVMISSLADSSGTVKVDLHSLLQGFVAQSSGVIRVDPASADGQYGGVSGLAVYNEADALIRYYDVNLFAGLADGQIDLQLGAHETVVLEFTRFRQIDGTSQAETLMGGNTWDRILALAANDTVSGGLGNDRILGGIGADTINGNAGNDRLIGGEGADRLIGGAGADYLEGGNGNDILTGGLGADAFVFQVGRTGRDVITDFDAAGGDRIILTGTGLDIADFGYAR